MSLPTTLSTCTVTGTYVDLIGNPIRGSITFTPQIIIKEKLENIIVMPIPIIKTLGANGSMSVVLPVSNDTDVIPQPFAYTVTENFTGGRSFELILPLSVANTTQNLADLLAAVSEVDSLNYTTTDQYVSLKSRYTIANRVRVFVIDADSLDAEYAASALATSNIAQDLADFTNRMFLVMGQ